MTDALLTRPLHHTLGIKVCSFIHKKLPVKKKYTCQANGMNFCLEDSGIVP